MLVCTNHRVGGVVLCTEAIELRQRRLDDVRVLVELLPLLRNAAVLGNEIAGTCRQVPLLLYLR